MNPELLLLLNVGATWFMVGLIWFVQIVHYPLFAKVEKANYTAYQKLHQKLTTFVVGPPMLIEALTAVLLATHSPAGVPSWLIFTGIGLVFVVWVSTVVFSIPCHGKLEQKFDAKVHRRLVTTNWPRTIAWTGRGALMLYAVFCYVSASN